MDDVQGSAYKPPLSFGNFFLHGLYWIRISRLACSHEAFLVGSHFYCVHVNVVYASTQLLAAENNLETRLAQGLYLFKAISSPVTVAICLVVGESRFTILKLYDNIRNQKF